MLFCDIADSTVLAERLGPERIHAVLNAFFEVALAEVHRYEGTVNQFLGDGFMLRGGASFAEIGEVLRHRSPQTTSIYARVDIDALRPLALPWPGGAQ